jgi:hypothetical protein
MRRTNARGPARTRRSRFWLVLAGALVVVGLLAFASSPAQAGSTVNVSTPAQLVTAVIGANPGDTIVLAPGNYPVTTALDVTVAGLTVEGPSTAPGATINGGFITNKSLIDPNQLDTFAVKSGASLTLHDVTLTGSIQPSNAAVFVQGGGAVSIDHSLFSGNTSNALEVKSGGQATVTDSTITDSIQGFDAILLQGSATLNEDTIADNEGDAIDNAPGSVASVTNTIMSNNGFGNCLTAINGTTNGTVSHDIDTDGTCGALVASTGGYSSVSAGLVPLANNGGPTNTYALQAGSVAIDHGTGAGAAADDQRHYTRDGSPDIGAFEFGATAGVAATLTVKKVVVGGTAVPSDFTLTVKDTTTNTVLDSSPGSSSGKQVQVPAGDNYTVTESGAQTADYTGSDSAGCAGTAAANGTPSCTITNTIKPTLLTVKKVVVGPGQPSDFTLKVTDTTTSAVLDSSPGSSSGHQVSVPPGDSYNVTESGATVGNYVAGSSGGCTGTATVNGTASCTITNTAKPTTLTVEKIVVGPDQPSAFTLTVTDTTTNMVVDSSPGSSSGKQVQVVAGDAYTVTESGATLANYNASSSAGCAGTATANGIVTCTITNTVKPTILTVKKVVVGPGQPSDFTLKVTDTTTNTVLDSSAGTSSGHQVAVPVGDSYTVTESGATLANYTASPSAGCTGTSTINGTATCTITNTAKPTTLTVAKVVVGGSAQPSDFTLTVTDTTTNAVLDASPGSAGKQVSVPAGDGYKVTESGSQTGSYTESDSAGCTGTATANGSLSCTITNTVKQAKLTVILHVVGSKTKPSTFAIHVQGGNARPSSFHGSKSGTKVTLSAGTYSVHAGSKKGFKGKLSGGCKGTVAPGGTATCKITETAKKHH